MNERQTEARLHEREVLEAARRRRIERLRSQQRSARDLETITHTCIDAAQQGQLEALVFRLPSELCTDGGRAINNGLPEWPQTLTGQARELYHYGQETLRPAGYRLRAAILTTLREFPATSASP